MKESCVKELLLMTTCLLSLVVTMAQIDSSELTEDFIEDLLSIEDEQMLEIFGEEFVERTIVANSVPNLNSLDYECAVSKLNLSDYQYYQLQLYIENYGEIYTIYELLAIDGFTKEDLKKLTNAVVVRPPPRRKVNFKKMFTGGKHLFWIRYGQLLEKAAGYDKSRSKHYDGSPAHITFRYEYNFDEKFGVKVAGGKEPGDSFFRGEQKLGFDHYSGSLFLRNMKIVKMALLGDFRVNFGQGLVLGSTLLSGRGGAPESVRKFDGGVRAVAITGEGSVLRGAGITLGTAKLYGTAFAGDCTNSEYSAVGGALKYFNKNFKIGVQFALLGVADDTASAIEKWNALSYNRQFNVSIDYSATLGRQLVFGEFAADGHGKIALFQSSVLKLTPDFNLGATVRHYSKDYTAPLASPFKANTLSCGETGLYVSCSFVLTKKIEATLFSDYYKLHDLSYRADFPVCGLDIGSFISVKFSRYSTLSVAYRFKNRPRNENNDEYMRRMMEFSSHRIRLQWINSPFNVLKMKTECSVVFNKSNDIWSKGLLAYHDVALNFKRPEISVNMRFAYFDTDSYEERLYAYENDVYYAFNIGSYYYRGVKCYLMLKYKLKNVSLWLRAARVKYFDRSLIGSGLNQIDKPHKTEIKTQIMVKF